MTNKLNSDKVLTSPKRILNVDLSYLPNCTEFLDFRKLELVSNFRPNMQVLVELGPNWQILA